MSRDKFKNLIVITVLFAVLAITAAVVASPNKAAEAPVMMYLPVVHRIPTPTPTPTPSPVPMAYFDVTNDTGGQLCIEVKNSGVGRKCTSGTELLYGPFPPGQYQYTASSARCGSLTETRYFYAGYNYEGFYCSGGSAGAGALNQQSVK